MQYFNGWDGAAAVSIQQAGSEFYPWERCGLSMWSLYSSHSCLGFLLSVLNSPSSNTTGRGRMIETVFVYRYQIFYL